MKNCLIVLLVLVGCFLVAAYLVLEQPWRPYLNNSQGPHMIATWRDYDDHDIQGLEVNVGTDRIIVDVPASPQSKQIIEQGHWNLHAFYVDSHLDSPPEIMVAQEQANEDLKVNIGHFLPSHPGDITCVKVMRLSDARPPYPVSEPNVKVAYPPPKGLISVGMLECDLQTLPWQPDKIVVGSDVVDVEVNKLSDGKLNQRYFPRLSQGDDDPSPPEYYHYHSDRADAPELLVTVSHGRVIEVTGGAEETADIPYHLPTPGSRGLSPSAPKDETWLVWLRNCIFSK